ncbi:MAG: FHA domain-containing protein [Kofleriaceae bacterium]
MKETSTRTDPAAIGWSWAPDDEVIQLREWGTGRTYQLPEPPVDEWAIGSARSCPIRLVDERRLISRQHARLVRGLTGWSLIDTSKNGVWMSNVRQRSFPLVPGIAFDIGTVRLVAESRRAIALRAFMSRLLGWDEHRLSDIDRALRAVREAATGKAALLLCGDSPLELARHLHDRTLGELAPFVVSDPRRLIMPASARSARNLPSSLDALRAAEHGTLCVVAKRLPHDFSTLLGHLRKPGHRVRLVVCAEALADMTQMFAPAIVVPALSTRQHELDRIIEEYAIDAIESLGATRADFSVADHSWLRELLPKSLGEVATATRRLVARRHWGTTVAAAAALGMSHVALRRWFERR